MREHVSHTPKGGTDLVQRRTLPCNYTHISEIPVYRPQIDRFSFYPTRIASAAVSRSKRNREGENQLLNPGRNNGRRLGSRAFDPGPLPTPRKQKQKRTKARVDQGGELSCVPLFRTELN